MNLPARFETIARTIALELGYELEKLWEKSLNKSSTDARREIARRLRDDGASFNEIGAVLRRNHTSAMNLVKPKAQSSRVRLRRIA